MNKLLTREEWLQELGESIERASQTAAPVAQPLTDEQASALWQKHLRVSGLDGGSIHGGVELIRAIERAHSIGQGGA